MSLDHIKLLTDDPGFSVIEKNVSEYHQLVDKLEKANIQHAHRDELLADARAIVVETIEETRRTQLAQVEAEIADLEKVYRAKMENGPDAAKRAGEDKLDYSTKTDKEIDDIARAYQTGEREFGDRLELAEIVNQLAERKSDHLPGFRIAISRRNGGAPWLRLAGDLPERREALKSCRWGALPVRIKSRENGNTSLVELDVSEYLK